MLTRTLSWQLVKVCKQYPVLFVTGPRKVGKTTLLKYFASSKYHFVSLNDLNERQLALTDPVLFLKNHEPPLIIDEFSMHLFCFLIFSLILTIIKVLMVFLYYQAQ